MSARISGSDSPGPERFWPELDAGSSWLGISRRKGVVPVTWTEADWADPLAGPEKEFRTAVRGLEMWSPVVYGF